MLRVSNKEGANYLNDICNYKQTLSHEIHVRDLFFKQVMIGGKHASLTTFTAQMLQRKYVTSFAIRLALFASLMRFCQL